MCSEDEKLVSQTLSGDRDAFGVLIHKYQEMVYAYAFQKVNNEADAQDITQEVFLRAYHHLERLRNPHQFRSWLYTIMSNECNRRLARIMKLRQRETALEDATEDDLRIESKHATPTEEWQVDLEQAISKLPDDNRIAVSMFYMSNCSLQEISEFLGVSVNTVKGKLYRARQQLGNALSEHYGKLMKSHKPKGGFLMQEIQFARPGDISGKIMNETGESIQNAEVRVQHIFRDASTSDLPEGDLGLDAIQIAPAKTDAHGEFVFHSLPEGARVHLVIQGPGYAKQTHFNTPVGTDGLEFRLKCEGRVEGNLSYAGTGAPVVNATVAVQGIHPSIHPRSGWGQTRTDATGNYLLKNLAPGTYNLFLYEGPEGWTAVAEELIEVVEGQTLSNIDLTLVRVGFITGRVTDQETNEPIANHYIAFHDAARPESQAEIHETQTDETGGYRFRATPGQVLIYTSAPTGYMDVGQVKRYVDVVESETAVVDFQFLKGIELVGQVLTEAGEPVANAEVSDVQNWELQTYGKSNEQGKFTVSGLRPGQHITLQAEHNGLQLRGMAEVEAQPGAPVEIQVQQYERVEVFGQVVNDKDEPVPSAKISLMRWYPHRNMAIGSQVAVTDGNGRYRKIGLIVGDKYIISASAQGYEGAKIEMFTATSETSQIANLVLPQITNWFFIEGRITDTSGEPVHKAQVYVKRPAYRETITDENGRYRLEDIPMPAISNPKGHDSLPPVLSELAIAHPEYALHVFNQVEPNQHHDLVLVKADGYLAGTVVDADGKPIEGAIVIVDVEENNDPSGGYIYLAVETNVLGQFEFKHIKDTVVPLDVSHGHDYKIFKDIAVNQRDLVLTLPQPKPKPKD